MSMTADHKWIYEPSSDNTARFVLGTVGENPLICVGVNPSTAIPNALDPTVESVERFATDNDYDSWILLNIYPLRATKPATLPHTPDTQLMATNVEQIQTLIGDRPLMLLAAWGNNVDDRPYLKNALESILQITATAGCSWLSLGEPNKSGHPHHPLYLRKNTPLLPFDIDRYRQETLRTA